MSDNINAFPVQRIEATITQNIAPNADVVGAFNVADEALLYADQKIYQYGQFGPYNQTLFLGCSVVNFNINLGWGAEATTLSISLVEDDSPHWLSSSFAINDSNLATSNNISKTVPPGDINSKRTFNAYNNSTRDPDRIDPDTAPNTIVSNVSTTNTYESINDATIGQDLHRNILLKEEIKKNTNVAENLLLSQATPSRPDFGKVYYEIKTDGTYVKKYWTGKDPGFVGESYDILGVTVRFIFHDFEFTGVVTSWKNNGGSGGKNLYTVEIKSLSTLLKNTQLIISYYPGTIFSLTKTKPSPFGLLSKFGLPSNHIGNRLNVLGSIDVKDSNYDEYDFVGSVAEGNIPNIFNIYGYLETVKGWGKHDINEQGTIVRDILLGMDDLINKSDSPSLGSEEDETPQDVVKLIDARFSPYGRIVGKAPAKIKQDGVYKDASVNSSSTIKFLKDQYIIVNPQNEEFKALKEIDIAEAELQSGSVTVSQQVLIGPDYANNVAGNINLTLNKMGLIPTFTSSDDIIRQHYTIDFSSLPLVPSEFRISGPVVSIMDLVNHICEANNHDYFIDFIPTGNPVGRNTIKVRTISRQQQPPNNYVGQLIKDSENRNILTSYDYGLEFNDEATLRSMYVGAKQKRLLQLTSNYLSRKNNSLLFDPKSAIRLTHDATNILNALRAPDHLLTRSRNSYYASLYQVDPTLGSGTGSIVYNGPTVYSSGNDAFTTSQWNWGTNVGRGNYHTATYYQNNSVINGIKHTNEDLFTDRVLPTFSINDEVGPFNIQGNNEDQNIINYPLWDDFICPYFGLDIDGNARKVFFDSKMQQIQVLCSIADIQNILGFALTTALSIQSNTTEQKDANDDPVPDPEPPKESTVSNKSDEEMEKISSNDANAIEKGKQEAAALQDVSVQTFHTKWNVTSREFSQGNEKFLLLENEIRAAMAGFDSWIYYTFNKNFTTDLGVILRYTLLSTTGLIVAEKSNDPAVERINKGEPAVSMVYHGPDPHIVGGNEADSPNSSASMMNDRVSKMLQDVHGYVKNIGDTYYGKQFMVKVPGLSISRDKPLTSNKEFDIQYETLQEPINEYKGQGRLYSNYKPATDGAWEEIGNIIDDTIIIGSITGDFFINDDGRFGPILGYNASYEYLNDTIPDITLEKPTKPDTQNSTNPTSAVNFRNLDNNKSNYKSNPAIVDKGESPGFITIDDLLKTAESFGEPGVVPYNNPPTLSMILALSSQPATGVDIIPNEWYASLITTMNNSDYLYYPYNFIGAPNVKELSSFTFANEEILKKSAYGSGVPPNNNIAFEGPGKDLKSHLKYKLYVKGSIEENFIFVKPYSESSYREARAIISIPAPIECNPVHLASKYVHHCLMVDSTIYKVVKGGTAPPDVAKTKEITWLKNPETKSFTTGTLIGGLFPFDGGFGPFSNTITNATDHFLDALNAVDKDANKAVTMPIVPKAAMPGFAAVPLESQAAVYGPWINYPWLVRKEIFTNPDIRNNDIYLKNSIENLVGGLKVNIVEEFAPWKFGSMKNLDMEAITRVENDSNYQIQQEVGTVNIPGAPIYRIGDFVDKISGLNSGPIINSIRTNIGDGGISTEYSLRTFTRRFGLFNKENAQRAAQISSERLSRRKAIALQNAEVTNRIGSRAKTTTLNDAPKRDYNNPPLPESWRSSSELLVGHNEFSIRLPSGFRASNSLEDGIDKVNNLIKYDASWPFNPVWKTGQPSTTGYDILNYPKIFSNTQIMDNREAVSILQSSYENTAFMSLDGLLSPISFYPTENARTYHITKYPRHLCRYCFGQGKIKYADGIQGLKNSLKLNISNLSPELSQQYTSKTIDCPFCEPEINKAQTLITSSKRGKINPPFIVTTGVDKIRSNPEEIGDTKVYRSVGTVINYSTLNPAILSYGEFSAFQNRQSGDYTSNSIRMLGIGTIPPSKESDSLNQMNTSDNRLYKSNLEYDQLYLDKVKEIHEMGGRSDANANLKKLKEKLPSNPRPFANNARFFGLRGPLMVHGWGYDTEGYPVPNASGEFQYDDQGNPLKAKLAADDKIEISVFKNQKFIPLDPETGRDQGGLSTAELEAAGVQIVLKDGKQGYYSAPYKEPTFARGWAQIPSTWPVGPVDLRWDESAKVWTAPSTYKNVYILLEEDLNNKNIARGEIIDNATDINNKILALGYRKVVFVKDNMGIYAAPRSSIIYCSYDQDGGFYEPISQNTFVTSGTIVSNTTANLYKLFYKDVSSLNNNVITNNNTPNFYVGKFSNPLDFNFSAGDNALFLYTKDGWILQSVRS